MILEAEEILFLEEKSFEYFSTLTSYTWKEVKYSVIPLCKAEMEKRVVWFCHTTTESENMLVASPSNRLWYAFTPYQFS